MIRVRKIEWLIPFDGNPKKLFWNKVSVYPDNICYSVLGKDRKPGTGSAPDINDTLWREVGHYNRDDMQRSTMCGVGKQLVKAAVICGHVVHWIQIAWLRR